MIKILACDSSLSFGKRVADAYGTELVPTTTTRFSDGEFAVSIEQTVRGKEVVIIQSTFPPSDNLFELLLLIDAAKRASAKRIIAVMPYFGMARQDRKDKPRVAIGAKLVANMLMAAGVDRVITMDLHADQIQGFFEVPVDHLFGSTLFLNHIKTHLQTDNLCIATPDTGGTKRAKFYSDMLNVDMAICYKQRKIANEVAEMIVIGEVSGKDVIIVDDMCDTAGTLTKAADLMIRHGALSVRAICTHAVLSGPAYERINDSILTELIVTDTIPLKEGVPKEKITVLPVHDQFAQVLKCLMNNESISSHFII
ncbi:MAG: ribose-phosphate pyrophosphokinase [Bacteroidetes bacterium]|nr:ribose-phosphate pyrophosphokinase [Bacteroidota bacterium]